QNPGGGDTEYCFGSSGKCRLKADEGTVYHELGHLLVDRHHWQRNDRRHYHVSRLPTASCSDSGETRCDTDAVDFGPFDYKSTMYYKASYPGQARYDGKHTCPATCGNIGSPGCTGPAPPSCPAGTNCATCAT